MYICIPVYAATVASHPGARRPVLLTSERGGRLGRRTRSIRLMAEIATTAAAAGARDGEEKAANDGTGGASGRRRLCVGVTGGISSGKSTVCRLLKDVHGARIVDADKLGHDLYTPGHPCLAQVIAAFGVDPQTPEGRKALGSIVFSDKARLQQLNRIVWPHIRTSMERILTDHRAGSTGHDTLFVEAAVLIEAGWQDSFDEVWVVWASPDIAVERLVQRSQARGRPLTIEQARERQQAQLSNEARMQFATVQIRNDEGPNELAAAVRREWVGHELRRTGKELGADEMLDVVDRETNTVIGRALRADVKRQKLVHRATFIFVRRRGTEKLYVQRRSMFKDYCPGYLDPVSGGCVGAGESYEENARRELEEELGLSGTAMSTLFDFFFDDGLHAPVWGRCFECEIDVDPAALQLQPEEVDAVYLMEPHAILALAGEPAGQANKQRDRVCPDSLEALGRYLAGRSNAAPSL